jgi:phosphohistidine phosphatase
MDDFNRPLNERGKHDAPEMAKALVNDHLQIDAFIASPAKRALKTARLFTREFQHPEDKIIQFPDLYNAPVQVFYTLTKSLDNSFNTVAIFAHNPGITEFVNSLTSFRIDEMPTCAVAGIKIHADKWEDFETASREFWFFKSPRLIRE